MAETRPTGNPPPPEFLVILGLLPPVTENDVKQAYLEKAKTAHPDRGGDPQQFVQLQKAFEQATEYARFKAGRMKWLGNWVEQYADQQQFIDEIKALGGSVEVESTDWLARSIGNDFAQVLDRIIVVRLAGPGIDDAVVARLVESRRSLGGLQTLELRGAKISDDGLAQLKAFESLHELDLSGTPVSLNVIEWLVGRLDRLKTLTLRDTGLGSLARMKLRFSNRKLDISF